MSTPVWTIVCDDTRKTSQFYFGEIVSRQVFTQLEDLKILLGEFTGGPVDGAHNIVCGTAINGELLAGQYEGRQPQRSSN